MKLTKAMIDKAERLGACAGPGDAIPWARKKPRTVEELAARSLIWLIWGIEHDIFPLDKLAKALPEMVFTKGHHVITEGWAIFGGTATAEVHDGEADFYGQSHGEIHGGKAGFHDQSRGTVHSGETWFFGQSHGEIHGGKAEFFNRSTGTIHGGRAGFFGQAKRINKKE